MGQTLFSGSRFVRWSLTPVLVLFMVFMPMALKNWDATKIGILAALEIVALALLAGFWLPRRFGVAAFRLVFAIVFLGYAAYLFSESRAWLAGDAPVYKGRKSQPSPLAALAGFVVIGLPAAVYAWRGSFIPGKTPTLERLAQQRAEREKRLLEPDWTFLEIHLQRPVPMALKALYAERDLILAEDLEYSDECTICFFEAIRSEGVWVDCHLGCDPLVFAMSVTGDPIYLKPGQAETDAVYITYHDGGDTQILAASVDEFVRRLKAANQGMR